MSGSSRMANSGHNLNTNPKVPALWVPAGSNISGDMQCVEVIGMVAKTYISVLNIPFFSVKQGGPQHAVVSPQIRYKGKGLFEENFTDPCTLIEKVVNVVQLLSR